MSDRGLPIVDGAPACPFVAFDDDRDERATSPDHRHRCYAEANPAPRALAHQEAYCLSSAFPVCPTFQDWARREAARARGQNARGRDADGDALVGAGAAGDGDGDDDQPQRNPPRNWAAPPPWLSRCGRSSRDDRFEDDGEDDEGAAFAAGQGRGLSGSYADRVASGGGAGSAAAAAGVAAAEAAAAATGAAGAAEAAPTPQPSEPARPEPTYHAAGWDEEPGDEPPDPPRFRRRERESARLAAASAPGEGRDAAGGRALPRHDRPAPEWERAKPLEAYPTLKSRRLSELSVPPILVAVVALALSAAVLFALPGLLGFGTPGVGGSPTPTFPVQTALPSFEPTPIPAPTPTVYVVKSGDTMSRIANKFGIALQDLIDANSENIPNPDALQIGDQVIIPIPVPTELPAATEIPAAS